jgi:hypothetical protein
MHELPQGLTVHCEKCNIVIPSDAPRPEGGDCAFVALHKLTWFNPKETITGQHCMATAAWALIYHETISAAHPESVSYLRQFKHERKAHFTASAVRKAMTPEQIEAGAAHRRDYKLFD